MRLVCLFLSLAIVFVLSLETVRRWDILPGRYRRSLPPLIAMFLVIAYGFAEAYSQEAPTGVRVIMWMIVAIWFLGAMLIGIRDRPRATDYHEDLHD